MNFKLHLIETATSIFMQKAPKTFRRRLLGIFSIFQSDVQNGPKGLDLIVGFLKSGRI